MSDSPVSPLLSFLSLVGGSVDQMGRPELRQCVEASVKCQGLEALAETLNTTPDTLQLIIDGLTQPPGFDIRQGKTSPLSQTYCHHSPITGVWCQSLVLGRI